MLCSADSESKWVTVLTLEEARRLEGETDAETSNLQNAKGWTAAEAGSCGHREECGPQNNAPPKKYPRPNPQNSAWQKALGKYNL